MGSLQQTHCTHGNRCGPRLESDLQGQLAGAAGGPGQDNTRNIHRVERAIRHNESVLSTCVGGRAHNHRGGGWKSPGETQVGPFPGKKNPRRALLPLQRLGGALMEARVIFSGRWWHQGSRSPSHGGVLLQPGAGLQVLQGQGKGNVTACVHCWPSSSALFFNTMDCWLK